MRDRFDDSNDSEQLRVPALASPETGAGEIAEVDIARDDGIQLPSFVLATMARPLAKDADQREQLFLSLAASAIRRRGERDPDWAARPQWLVPLQAARAEADILSGLKGFDLRLRHRIAAGRMASPFLREVEEGKPPPLPKSVKRLSLNQMAELVMDDVAMADTVNVTERVWRQSKPVIHLCAALTVTRQEALAAGAPMESLTTAFADKAFLQRVLGRAMVFEGFLPLSRLRIAPETLLRFHLIG
jgi:hypothetical protein